MDFMSIGAEYLLRLFEFYELRQILANNDIFESHLGIRHVQVILLFFAMIFAFNMRTNMSMAIVAMTDTNNDSSFNWSVQKQGVILSSFFWGYFVLQIPAGELARKFGGHIFITIVVAGNAAISLMIPLAAYYGGWKAVCACRTLQGLCQGFLFPSMHNIISKWVPLEEKSRLGTLIYNGAELGSAFQLLGSGFIADSWGWPAIFYVSGTLGAIWTVAYVILGADSPENSKMISDEEKFYIQNSLSQVGEQRKLQTPWKPIGRSLPFYALMIAQCGHLWGFWTLATEIPTYMKNILEFDIKANGAMSALPYFAMYLLSIPFGFLSDYSLEKKWVSISTARKISNTVGQWGPAIALIGLTYVPPENAKLAVVLLILVVGINAGYFTGFLLVHIDMAPNFAGPLMGITNCVANGITIVTPILVGLILQDESDPKQWHTVFYVASAVYFTTNLIFLVFGTSERQPWNEPVESHEEITDKAE